MLRTLCLVIPVLFKINMGQAAQVDEAWTKKLAILLSQTEIRNLSANSVAAYFSPVLSLSRDLHSRCKADFIAGEMPSFITTAKLSLILPHRYFSTGQVDSQLACEHFRFGIMEISFAKVGTADLVSQLNKQFGHSEAGLASIRWSLPQRGAVVLNPASDHSGPELTIAIPQR